MYTVAKRSPISAELLYCPGCSLDAAMAHGAILAWIQVTSGNTVQRDRPRQTDGRTGRHKATQYTALYKQRREVKKGHVATTTPFRVICYP